MTIEATSALALWIAAGAVAILCHGPARRVALVVLAALVAMRLFVWAAPDQWRYLASTAVWVAVGSEAIRRGVIPAGVLSIASGLCYVGQEVAQSPPMFGNPYLMAADLFGWLALLGVLHHGISGGCCAMGFMGGGADRRRDVALRCILGTKKEAGR